MTTYEMTCLVLRDLVKQTLLLYEPLKTTRNNGLSHPSSLGITFLSTTCTHLVGVKRKQRMSQLSWPSEGMSKWISSSPEVSATVPEVERAVPDKNLELVELPSGRPQGVRRDPQSDSLRLALEHTDRPPAQNTKCGIFKRLAGCMIPWDGLGHLSSAQKPCCNSLGLVV